MATGLGLATSAMALFLSQAAHAADLYWDVNGVTAGASGGTTAAGTWDTTNAFWNTDSSGGGAGTFASLTTLSDHLFFSAGSNATGNFTVTVSGAQAAGGITVEDGNQFALAGSNTPSLTVGSGGITVTNAARLTAGATLPTYLLAGSQTWTNNSSSSASAFVTSSSATISGVADTGSIAFTLSGTHAVNTNGSEIRGFIADGTGNVLSVVKNGTGIWQLYGGSTNTNTYSGGTILNSGELQINSISTLHGTSSALGTGTLTINGGTLTSRNGSKTITNAVVVNGDFTLNGANAGGNTLTLSGTVDLGGGTRTIAVDATTGAAVISGVISNGGLTKAGTRTLTLSAANTYTGATTIQGGTLALGATGSIDDTSELVLAGGTFNVSAKTGGYMVNNLRGTGAVVGALTVSTELSIGASPGTMTFTGDLALTSGTTFEYEVDGGTNLADLGIVSGGLDLGGATLDLVQLGAWTNGDTFTLFGATGGVSGTFSGLNEGDSFNAGGGIWTISYSSTTAGQNWTGGTDGFTFVNVTAVPEPTVACLGGLGLLLLLRRRK